MYIYLEEYKNIEAIILKIINNNDYNACFEK
jgi:hypothetical protein